MKTSLIDTIFFSEKRKNLLLLLMDDPKTIDEIKKELDVTSTAMLPQIKKLKENRLVVQNKGAYELSDIGEAVVEKMQPLVDILSVLGDNYDYWSNRDLNGIPKQLFKRIGELGECTVVEPDLNHMFEPPQQLKDSLDTTKRVMTFYSYFCPECPYNYSRLAEKGVEFSLVLTVPVFERLRDEYPEQMNAIMVSESANLFISTSESPIGALSVTDDLMLLSLFNKEGIFDHRKIMSFGSDALKWAEELFNHYLDTAEPVKLDR